MMDGFLDRRRFLRGLGTVALVGASGCSALSGEGKSPPTIPASALGTIVDDAPPTIPERVPVEIEPTYLDSIETTIRDTLTQVPSPFTATDIPNGAIREDLNQHRDRVDTYLQAAAEAASPYEALRRYRRAQERAAQVAAAWATVDADLTRDAVLERTAELEAERSAFTRRWEYLGDEPERSTVVHSILEQRLRTTERIATIVESDLEREPPNAITIGELAGSIERGFGAIEDAAYLYDRYLESLTEPTDQRPTFEAAAASLVGTIESRRASLPSIEPSNPSALVDRDISDTPAAEALEELYWRLDAPRYSSEERAAGRPAHAIVIAKTILARFRALSSIRDDVEAGESYEIESADDVRAIRSAAISALTAAQDAIDSVVLANGDLARLANQLQDVDRRLEPHDDDVRADLLGYEVAEYVQIAAMARALPETTKQVETALVSSR